MNSEKCFWGKLHSGKLDLGKTFFWNWTKSNLRIFKTSSHSDDESNMVPNEPSTENGLYENVGFEKNTIDLNHSIQGERCNFLLALCVDR